MLDRLASGGIFTVIIVALLALGYARVFDAKRQVYIGIGVAVCVTILGSQILPAENLFRMTIVGNLRFIATVLAWSSPILLYALLIRAIRKKTNET